MYGRIAWERYERVVWQNMIESCMAKQDRDFYGKKERFVWNKQRDMYGKNKNNLAVKQEYV